MTDYEKKIEERLPDIETLEKSVSELNELDLNTISISELKDKIHESFPIINFGDVKWDSSYHLFRVRKKFRNRFNEPYKDLNSIGLPPTHVTPFGRANNEFEPVFYGSNEGDLALFESCQKITESERFSPQNFTMGIWKVKENETLRLVAIVESEITQKNRTDIQEAVKRSDKLMTSQLTSEKVIKASKIISCFFAEQFAKSNIKSPNDYKISSFFSNYIKDINALSRIKFDGILYPSVAHKFRAENVALFPHSITKLEIVKCLSVTAYNFDFDKPSLTKGIIAEGTLMENEEINWNEKQ